MASTSSSPASRFRSAAKSISKRVRAPATPSLTQQAYAEIKHRILTLAFRPGEFLNESVVCQLLGVGRTPVHEAMHRLKLEGLVEIIPRKGVLVRPDSLNDVIALLEARMVIEPPCMGLAAERAQAQLLDELEALQQQAQAAFAEGDREQQMLLDARFHDALASGAGNTVLAEVMRLLHQRASRIWYLQVWSNADLQHNRLEHEAIAEAVKRGDRAGAIAAAQSHLTSLRRRILDRTVV